MSFSFPSGAVRTDATPHIAACRMPHAQHFDAFLAWPGFGERHVPTLAYAHAALERMFAHVVRGKPLAAGTEPDAQPAARARARQRISLCRLDCPHTVKRNPSTRSQTTHSQEGP